MKNNLTEETFKIIDVLLDVAKKAGTSPARVALAWVQNRPGVASTIIGARTVEQLDDNIEALEVNLKPEHINALDEVSQPKLNFPHDFLKFAGTFEYGGTTINGESFPVWPMSPQNDGERYAARHDGQSTSTEPKPSGTTPRPMEQDRTVKARA